MGIAIKKPKMHSYITHKKGVCGGRSIIDGTRISVWGIIKWYKSGMSIEEILKGYPHLTPAQVYDAFSYYYDNQEEIEKDLADNEEDHVRGTRK
ncbi:MAG TPA: DUF433 domain-containing protein [Nitrospiria bacterium]|nr:DUF433 domain-containing protein [Nitrospiria bacterium]